MNVRRVRLGAVQPSIEHTTIEQVHTAFGPGPYWIACHHPERPPDEWAIWSWDCDACILHLTTAVAHRDDLHPTTTGPSGTVFDLTLPEILDKALAWRATR